MILSISLIINVLFAQEQPSEYLQRKLIVEVEGQTIVSFTDWDNYLTKSTRIGGGILTLNQIRKWKAYQSGFEISEWDFFHIVGYHEQARRAKAYKEGRDLLGYGGFGIALLGCGIAFYELIRWQSSGYEAELNEGICWCGLGIAGIGLTFEIIGFSRPPKMAPASFAVEVANDYNKRLK